MLHQQNRRSAFCLACFGFVFASVLAGTLAATPAVAEGLRIDTPKDGAVINDVAGNLLLEIDLEQTDLAPRMRFRALLDGKQVTPSSYVPIFRLRDILPGWHELEVQIVDTDDNVMATSDPVKFEMRRSAGPGE